MSLGVRYVMSGRYVAYRGRVQYLWEICLTGKVDGFVTSRGSVRYRGWVSYVREIC